EYRDAEEGELEGTGRLLQRDRRERPQHETDEIGDRPNHAVGDAADAGWKDFRGEHGAGSPETEEAEAPRQAEDPQQQAAVAVDPGGEEGGALDQHDDEAGPPADSIG